jgi:hypothetical protein
VKEFEDRKYTSNTTTWKSNSWSRREAPFLMLGPAGGSSVTVIMSKDGEGDRGGEKPGKDIRLQE